MLVFVEQTKGRSEAEERREFNIPAASALSCLSVLLGASFRLQEAAVKAARLISASDARKEQTEP